MFDLTLCPACICEYEGKFGTEPHDRIVLGVQYKLCSEHKDRNFAEEMGNADEKLEEAHRHNNLRFFRNS